MSFANKVINGSLRYRATKALDSILQIPPKVSNTSVFAETEDSEETRQRSIASRLRQHPFFLSLPALALPSQLDRAAINYLRDNSLSSPKSIEDRAELLSNYLWSRPLIMESNIVKRGTSEDTLSVGSVEDIDPDLAEAIQYHHFDSLTKLRAGARHKIEQESLEGWKSLTYSGHNCELYLTARLAPNFASACRVLYEIRKRCPQFIPRNLFDFGSGLGTVTWAVNTVWPVGCVREHYMVDPSADMTQISEFLLRKNLVVRTPETIFPGIYHRRFMPENKQTYDLVVSAHSLLELPGKQARQRVLSKLWNRTSNFLVLIEQGTRAGFSSILEARDWLINQNGDEARIFAPCPHNQLCGKRESVCNISVRYYHFGLTREKNEPLTELICYLIVSRGDWRKHQTPAVNAEPPYLPRLVSYKTGRGSNVTHDICLPCSSVERVAFPKPKTDKSLYFYLKHARAGDIVPCEPIDPLEQVKPTDSDPDDD